MATVFVRVHDAEPEAKATTLAARLRPLRSNGELAGNVFVVDEVDFGAIPGSPFAYWVGPEVRRIFREFPPLEGSVAEVRVGLQTSDDFRFLRAWWEVDPSRIGFSEDETKQGRSWVHFAKGGSYSPYYADLHLVANWGQNGHEMKAWASSLYNHSHWSRIIKNVDYYFRPGLTWPRRTQGGFGVRALPAGGCFADKGPAVLADPGVLPQLLGLMNSKVFAVLVETQMAFGSYEVGVIQRTPIPPNLAREHQLRECALQAHELLQTAAAGAEETHAFQGPVVRCKGPSLERALSTTDLRRQESAGHLLELRATAESLADAAYGVNGVGEQAATGIREDDEPPDDAENEDHEAGTLASRLAELFQWSVGVAYGRWDVRLARDGGLVPALQSPFERLPVVAPAGLVGPDGLPATPERIASEAWLRARPNVITLPEPGSFEGPASIPAAEYPIEVAWDGILVDDEGHARDIVAKVREVLRYVYGERAEAIEEEALTLLRGEGTRPASLREWFRDQKAAGLGKTFFDFHIQRYSKSRRKAPIYWRLGGAHYSVWLYYHRLTDDTLWRVLNQYVQPKQEMEARRGQELRQRLVGKEGREARQLEAVLAETEALVQELEGFAKKLRAVAERGYAPDRDDGVIINLAPLHAVVPWKEPAAVWEELEAGKYDWAKLALRWWPERVRAKCATDKSLAIAHHLEPLYQGD